jgi:exonuclease SbcC
MHIKTIRFQNINSLRNEHVIDFTDKPLSEAGLFAITGSTGSGKSTILDVISLALYNRIPRFDVKHISKGFIEKTGSILTRNTKEAYAEVVYDCHEGEYRSKWSISTARTGNLRDHDMELADNKTSKILDLKKTDVPRKNEELIGLNYEQFIRSILLAQGDFAKFLQSDKDERGALLEKITGSWIYREIGKKAYELSKYYGQELEKIQERARQTKESLITEEEYNKLKEQFNTLEKNIETQEKEKKANEELLKHKDEIEKVQKNLQEAIEKENTETEKLKTFKENQGGRLQKHKQLIPWEEILRNWKQKNTELNNHLEKKEELNNKLEKTKEQSNEAHKAIETMLVKELNRDELIPELDAFEKKILDLTQEQADLRKEFSFNQEKAREILKRQDLSIDLKNPSEGKKQLISQKNQAEEKLRQIKTNLEEISLESPQQSLETIKQHIELAKKLQTATEWSNYYNKETEKLNQKLSIQKQTQQTLPAKIKEAEQNEHNLSMKLENLRQSQQINQLTARLEEQRQNLQPGKPCPLCGSKNHPYVEEYTPQTDDLTSQINTKKEEHDHALSILKELQAQKKQLEKEIKETKDKIKEFKEEYSKKEKEIASIHKQLPEQYRNQEPQSLSEELSAKKEELEKYIDLKERRASLDTLNPILEQLETILQKGRQKSRELESLYTGKDIQKDVDGLKKHLNDASYNLQTAQKDLTNWENDKNRIKQELEKQEEKMQPMLEELEYSNIKEAWNNLLPPSEYDNLQKELNRMEAAIASAKSEKKTYEKQYNSLIQKDTEKSRETLQKTLRQLTDELNQRKSDRDKLFAKIDFQEKQKQTLKELEDKIAEQKEKNEKWVLLNQYIGDAQGKNFSTFAQQLTLEQLVKLANKRISELSRRYILDIPGKNEDESLVIKDIDMGGQRRSVKTLSGGESFLISLSLALALSDLASRNVEIKSLFIDEGFGSLDQLTLDQTLDTLERLQAESEKTIGVISHIEALKERMDTQIEVIRDGQGFSSIEVKHNGGII